MVDAAAGDNLLEVAHNAGIEIHHACDGSCACTTCHVVIREGFDSLNEASDQEEDMLDKAWGLEMDSRLSCQCVVGDEDLVVEILNIILTMRMRRLTNEMDGCTTYCRRAV